MSAQQDFEDRCIASGVANLFGRNAFHPGSAAHTWFERGREAAKTVMAQHPDTKPEELLARVQDYLAFHAA